MEAIIVIVISALGIVVMAMVLKKIIRRIIRRRVLEKKLRDLLPSYSLKSIKKDFFSGKLLVLDNANKKLVYLDYLNAGNDTVIHLPDLKECRLTARGIVIRIELKFCNPYRDTVCVNFYRRFIDPEYMRGHLSSKAKLWNELLTAAIAKHKEFEYGITG